MFETPPVPSWQLGRSQPCEPPIWVTPGAFADPPEAVDYRRTGRLARSSPFPLDPARAGNDENRNRKNFVYSVDHDAIVVVPLLKVEHTRVARHRVVPATLADGRVLEISPGHPTADGRMPRLTSCRRLAPERITQREP